MNREDSGPWRVTDRVANPELLGVVLEAEQGRDAGRWWPARDLFGKKTATYWCPLCGLSMSLSGHAVDPAGLVSPSVVCPSPACRFHEHVRLVGWAEPVG